MDFLDRIRRHALVPDAASWSFCLQTGQQSTGAQVDKSGGGMGGGWKGGGVELPVFFVAGQGGE